MDVTLNVARANGDIKEISLKKKTTILGRGADCDLRIPLESCSRHHAEIRIEGDRVFVKDLDSSNGTYINNEKIAEAEVEAGDSLAIGPVVIRFRIDGEPEELPDLPPTAFPSTEDDEEFEEIEEHYEDDDEEYEETEEEVADTVSEEFEEEEEQEDEDDPLAALAGAASGGDALEALAAASSGEDEGAENALDALAGAAGDDDEED
jgi:pSer/pThr/pTyr-binding forkhead associated (FHA) protein